MALNKGTLAKSGNIFNRHKSRRLVLPVICAPAGNSELEVSATVAYIFTDFDLPVLSPGEISSFLYCSVGSCIDESNRKKRHVTG